MKPNLFNTIESIIPELSKGHKKIAQFILEHYEKAVFMTASKLGNEVGVSESTVVRFAMELGFEGYPELQRELKEVASNKLTAVQRIDVMNERFGDEDVYEKILNMDIDRLKKTLEEGSREEFYGAVEKFCSAKRIYIIGARSAAVLAKFMSFYFEMIFDNVKLINATSTSELFEQILGINENDAMIGISFPRYSKHTVKALKYATEKGASVVAITDSLISPLAKYSGNVILARSDMASFADSLVAPMSVINALIVAVGMKRHDDVVKNYKQLEEVCEKYDIYSSFNER